MHIGKICFRFIILFLLNASILMGQNRQLDSLKQLFVEETNLTEKANLARRIGAKLLTIDLDSSFVYLHKALDIATSIKDINIAIITKNNLAGYYYHHGKLDTGIIILKEILPSLPQANATAKARTYNSLGILHDNLGNFSEALENYSKGLAIVEASGNYLQQAVSRTNIALTYVALEKYNEAKGEYHKAIQIAKQHGYENRLGSYYANMGLLHMNNLLQLDSAEYYLKLALEKASAFPNKRALQYSYTNLGTLFYKKKAYQEALKYFEAALAINQSWDGQKERVYIYIGILECSMELELWAKANEISRALRQIAPTIERVEPKRDVYEALSAYSEKQLNFNQSLSDFKTFKTLDDSIQLNSQKTVQELRIKYEQEKKAKELAEKNLDLFQLQKEKRTISYFAFGSILVLLLSGLIWFYRNRLNHHRKMEKLKKQIATNLHDDTNNIINGINKIATLIHENELSKKEQEVELLRISRLSKDALSNMSDIIWSLNEKEASFGSLLSKIQDFVDDTLLPLKIKFELTVNPETITSQNLGRDYRHQLLMVFKEVISNSIKHIHPQKIKLAINQESDKYLINIVNWFEKERAVNFSNGQGLQNIERRIERLNGEVAFQQQSDRFMVKIYLDFL